MSLWKFIRCLISEVEDNRQQSSNPRGFRTNPKDQQEPPPVQVRAELELPQAVVDAYIADHQRKKPLDRFQRYELGVATMTFFAVAAYAFVSSCQLRTMQRQLDAMQIEQRPWIGVTGFVLSEEPTSGKAIIVAIGINNTESTPALNVRQETSAIIDNTNRNVDWKTEQLKDTIVVFPKADPFILKGIHFTTADESASYMRPGTDVGIFARVRITYDDVFNCRHFTEVCAAHKFGEALNSFGICGDAKYYRVDTERDCQPPLKR